ncbi:MAG: class I SAM-dependent methyltransferase [Candidatus Omnitrophota bacterium]
MNIANFDTKINRSFYENFYRGGIVDRSRVETLKQSYRIALIRSLAGNLGIGASKKVLIIGCGSGDDIAVYNHGVIASDLSFNAIKLSRHRYPDNKYVVADCSYLPFKNNYFDFAICSEVIEHINSPIYLLSEVYRVLQENGALIITVPNWLSFFGVARKTLELLVGHSITANNQPIDNWYTFKTLRRRLLKCHLEIQCIRGCWYFPPISWRNLALLPDSLAYRILGKLIKIDKFLGRKIPFLGHIILAVCKK